MSNCSYLHVAFGGETEQNLLVHVSPDFNYVLLCVFVLVVELQKLEVQVCIHKQECLFSSWSES